MLAFAAVQPTTLLNINVHSEFKQYEASSIAVSTEYLLPSYAFCCLVLRQQACYFMDPYRLAALHRFLRQSGVGNGMVFGAFRCSTSTETHF